VLGDMPTPEMGVLAAEECQRLLSLLPDDSLQEIALAKLEGYTNEEIAERLHCAPRTVERKLGKIREAWELEMKVGEICDQLGEQVDGGDED